MSEVELTIEAAKPKPKLVRRHSAGGMMMHNWQESGKPTVIQAVLELAGEGISTEALTELINVRLLKRFPRFRGYVSANKRHWVVPEPDAVDPKKYVSDIALEGGDHRASLLALLGHEFRKPLPAQCSWEVQRVACAGRVALLFRFGHTVADAVILVQILKHGICDTNPPAGAPSSIGAPSSTGAPPPAATTITPTTADGTRPSARPPSSLARAGCLERLWAIVSGLSCLLFILCWRADRRTCISLGPSAWARRQKRTHANRAVVALSQPVAVGAVKAAARKHHATVNDVILAALAAGLHQHLLDSSSPDGAGGVTPAAALARLKRLRLTATMFVNPRPEGFSMSAASAKTLLDSYADMSTYGCNLGIALIALPCGGGLTPAERLKRIRATTRHLKLSLDVAFLLLVLTLCYK